MEKRNYTEEEIQKIADELFSGEKEGRERILMKFNVAGENYIIYGDFDTEESTDYSGQKYKYPEFYNSSAKIFNRETDKWDNFIPKCSTWSGRQLNVADMLNSTTASLIIDGQAYQFEYIDAELNEFIKEYHREDNIHSVINDLKIPKTILYCDMYRLYELVMITDQFIYYQDCEDFLMFRTKDHSLVSDNYFASVGYEESRENIHKSEDDEDSEVCIFDRYPDTKEE